MFLYFILLQIYVSVFIILLFITILFRNKLTKSSFKSSDHLILIILFLFLILYIYIYIYQARFVNNKMIIYMFSHISSDSSVL